MNKKTALVMVTAILLAVAAGAVGATYSRYTSTATATPQAQVAKWAVKVGEADISDGKSHSFNATINWDENKNVLNNGQTLIAPGSTGTLSFIIDAKTSQVAVDYEVVIDDSQLNSHPQIAIKEVSATPSSGQKKVLTEQSDKYSGNIALSDVNTPVTITVKLEWTNDGSHDTDDTSLGNTAPLLSLPITVTVSQHI